MSRCRELSEASGRACCDAEEIFDLSEGALDPARAREVRVHLRECPRCRSLHERELSLSAALSPPRAQALAYAEAYAGVSRRVALALPTRSVAARVMWGAGAAALLAAALVSLALHSVAPFTFVTKFMGACWGLTSGLSDAAGILLAVSGSTILIALAVGALVDTLIAATVLAVARWWRPRGA